MVLHIPTDDMTMVESILIIQSICITQSVSSTASSINLKFPGRRRGLDKDTSLNTTGVKFRSDMFLFHSFPNMESLHILTRPHFLSIKGYNPSEQVNKIRGFLCFQTLKMNMFYRFKAYTSSSII